MNQVVLKAINKNNAGKGCFIIGLILVTLSAVVGIGFSKEKYFTANRIQNNFGISDTSYKGLVDHGVFSPYANDRGVIAVETKNGENKVMVWLFDHRGGYGLLMIDANTGRSKQFSMPFELKGDAVYSSIYASNGNLYTLYDNQFVEFNPNKEAFTYNKETTPGMAMSMTEDDSGQIWAVTYPNSGLVCFNPKTRGFTDYGSLNKENWRQYPSSVSVDDYGYVYFGIGNTSSQIFIFDPESQKVQSVLSDSDRKHGTAVVRRDKNGKVYGQASGNTGEEWYELYRGKVKKIGADHVVTEKEIITGNQALRYLVFPNGQKVKSIDMINRKLMIANHRGDTTLHFDYDTEGALVMNITLAPDKNSIIGGSTFPMMLVRYYPDKGDWHRTEALGQYNATFTGRDNVLFGSYPNGQMIVWQPPDDQGALTKLGGKESQNILFEATPEIHRPFRIITDPENQVAVMGGTPAYGYTGGGLLFFNLENKKEVLLADTQVVKNQSTESLTFLNNNELLGGTTTQPGTGGEKKADQAFLYIMNKTTKQIIWKAPGIKDAQAYNELYLAKNGLVYGIADLKTFFVFDPSKKAITHEVNLDDKLDRTIWSQSPQIFVRGTDDETYLLLQKGIAIVDTDGVGLKLLVEFPMSITNGGAYLKDRIYFMSGSHLFSYNLNDETGQK